MAGDRHSPTAAPPRPKGGPDEELLVQRAAEGDEDAFADLVRSHSGTLVGLATRLLDNRTEAEDAVQESLLSAWRRLPDFRGDAAFGSWLYRIVTNRCTNILRSRRPDAPLEAARAAAAADASAGPERIAEGRAAVHDIRRAMRGLSPEQRTCWVLRELEGQSYEFIARTVGISEEAVRARVFRARRHLTNALGAWR